VNRFLTTHQHNNVIHVGSHWKIWDKRQIKHTDNTQATHNPEKAKANNAKQNYNSSFALRQKLRWAYSTLWAIKNETLLFFRTTL